METEPVLPGYIRASIALMGLTLSIYILYLGQSIFAPLVFALFIAILINPMVNFFTRHKINRIVAIFLAVVIVVIFALGIVAFLTAQVAMFSESSAQFGQKFNLLGDELIQWTSTTFHINTAAIQKWLKDTESNLAKNIFGTLGPAILSVGGAMIALFIIPVFIFLILFYKVLLLEFTGQLFLAKHHKTVIEVLESVNDIIRKYLTGLLIEGAIVAVLNSVALLAIGVEYAILLGIVGAILNVIPYIGGIIAVAIPMLIALVTKSALSSLLVLIAYILIQFVDNHYLVPYIVASKVKINALVAIIVVLVGNFIWGVPGMFLSIPITALVKVVCDHIEQLRPIGFLLGDAIPEPDKLIFIKKIK